MSEQYIANGFLYLIISIVAIVLGLTGLAAAKLILSAKLEESVQLVKDRGIKRPALIWITWANPTALKTWQQIKDYNPSYKKVYVRSLIISILSMGFIAIGMLFFVKYLKM